MRDLRKGIVALMALTVAAAGTIASAGLVAAQDGPVIGVSWNNYNEERWLNSDEPAIKAAVEAAGGKYISTDAKSDAATQLTDVENLITQGAQALIILAQDKDAILPAVKAASDAGIPVIAYDRIIEDPSVLYMTFDNVGVGKAMAEVIFGLVPAGNYAVIKGNEADENTRFLKSGMDEVIGDAWAPGAPGEHDPITVVCETYTDNWLAENAQANMEQCLTAVDNQVDAVLAENDGMAGGVIAALEAQGLSVPVSGQDGDKAALNRVAQGRQSDSVWKDSRQLGKAAGEAAVAMATGTAMADLANVVQFTSPSGADLTSVFLAPTPVTQANLNAPVDGGQITLEELCADVAAGTVAICDGGAASMAPAESPAT
jgi:D-xylose transport system substrate-binding protein